MLRPSGADLPAPGPARRRLLPDPVRLAIGTLTAFPVPPPASLGPRTAGGAMLLAPLVGLLLGALAAAPAAAGYALGLPVLAAATLALATLALATRALHLDGLADTADGLAASYDRERALAVMRLGNVGPAGVATLVLVLLLQISALAQAALPPPPGWFSYEPASEAGGRPVINHLLGLEPAPEVAGPVALVVALALAAAAGRCALLVACLRGVPSARPSGLGATVAGTVPRLGAAAVLLLTGAVAAALAGGLGRPWWQGVLAVGLGALAAAAVTFRATRRFGGITGDVLGAGVELATAAALLVLAAS